MEDSTDTRNRLLHAVARANDFCVTVQNVSEFEKEDFIEALLTMLPPLYSDFNDMESIDASDAYLGSYMDEEYYEQIRRKMQRLFGEDDVFLETMVEEMKYSDTPVGVSISESLADIFQDLYNFISAVKDSDGDMLDEAYAVCRENFREYWSQTLCNVLRPLNRLRYHHQDD